MKNIGKILAALLAVAVMLSFTMVTVFAEDVTETVADSSVDTDGETATETEAADEDDQETSETEATDSDEETDEDKFLRMTGLVTLGIIVVVLICVAVWAFKDKERALKTWRSFKSEFKKIVWADRHQTTKNTILVILVVVVFGAVIGLLDYLFSLGVVGLGNLI